MLKDADHPRWQDEEIETYVAERMADSSEALKTSIRLLNAELKALNFDQAESDIRDGHQYTAVHQRLPHSDRTDGLRKPADVDAHEAQNTDYYTADRARHDAASILGPRYAEVVRKCIQCDFGPVDDLEKAKLQEASHQDVIYELEELEERFRSVEIS
ncbi:hypothetical protein AYO22_11492 [Fonsecaea multimorphosa]|nr:hypothetical protein AYO22_11492 [Fonsecaea multimorphosa]